MAILRGVENGFSEVRTARIGRLTISDPYGRITAEANSSNGKAISLLGRVSVNRLDTFYSKFGDWFGIIILITAIIFILGGVIKRN
jgi:apolipoprotein N-acyltransferase